MHPVEVKIVVAIVVEPAKFTSSLPPEGVWGYFSNDRCSWGISPRGAGYSFRQDINEQFNHSND